MTFFAKMNFKIESLSVKFNLNFRAKYSAQNRNCFDNLIFARKISDSKPFSKPPSKANMEMETRMSLQASLMLWCFWASMNWSRQFSSSYWVLRAIAGSLSGSKMSKLSVLGKSAIWNENNFTLCLGIKWLILTLCYSATECWVMSSELRS